MDDTATNNPETLLEIDPYLMKEILAAASEGLKPQDVLFGELIECPGCGHQFNISPTDRV